MGKVAQSPPPPKDGSCALYFTFGLGGGEGGEWAFPYQTYMDNRGS
jgi:hypothetical protein